MTDSVTATATSPAPSLAERLAEVRANIAAACARVNRPVESVTLVAVSKTHPASAILEAVAEGQFHFGENRIEEAIAKIPQVAAGQATRLTWHMIGHVQSRKAEEVVGIFDMIHSLESVKLAERYARFARLPPLATQPPLSVLLEINVSGEASKSGFAAQQWQTDAQQRRALWEAVGQIVALPQLQVRGLMTMAPIVEAAEATRPVFAALRQLRDALANDFPSAVWDTLSMGMTDDYPVAIEEGATLVRVGRAIFGERNSAQH